jgi:UDP-glucose 4-epimerase
MASFLVTGELSCVGLHFTEELYYVGHDETLLDHLSNNYQSYLSHLKNKITLYIPNVEKLNLSSLKI